VASVTGNHRRRVQVDVSRIEIAAKLLMTKHLCPEVACHQHPAKTLRERYATFRLRSATRRAVAIAEIATLAALFD
jgi:hypothetical protein